ncbi:hypothetical protein [Methylobacterium planeticum]|uniref:Uncharacterized protein n=1 Tax=Methylobacterium planeticum TaxID=2615211 RepID=A0A6N6MSJ6_9HYPH|nr:hypothetical protein [Methylobacterium planeticum]KAB1074617.1 hypothetical protein F6X51_05650 [Methylobacterium planeticum]
MRNTIILATFIVSLGAATAARAEGGEGSRQQAGGAHMSSYVNHPYHDPRSVYAQRRGTGQILGAPMLTDQGPSNLDRRAAERSSWAVGRAPRRR